jgi:hypothetical protein
VLRICCIRCVQIGFGVGPCLQGPNAETARGTIVLGKVAFDQSRGHAAFGPRCSLARSLARSLDSLSGDGESRQVAILGEVKTTSLIRNPSYERYRTRPAPLDLARLRPQPWRVKNRDMKGFVGT